MNKLLEWLKGIERKPAWLCRKIGIHDSYMSVVINGKKPLSLKYVEQIFELSEGSVGLKDLRPDLYKQYKTYKCLKDIL